MVSEKIRVLATIENENKKFVLRRFEKQDIHRIFMAWNNPQSYRYNTIDWNERDVEEILNYSWPNESGMYLMVLENEETHEIVATCRFGTPDKLKPKEWDFGYCTFRNDVKEEYTLEDLQSAFIDGVKKDSLCWGKGYSTIMLDTIIKIAQSEGVETIISGADGLNWGSQKVMMKNGMTFYEIENDGDVDFIIRLKDKNGQSIVLTKPSKDELESIWQNHIKIIQNAHKTESIREKKEIAEKNHYGDALVFLLLNRASKILLYGNCEQEKLTILKNDIKNIYSKFKINKLGYNEIELFKERFISFQNRWQERVGNLSFNQENVEFNLKCCDIVEKQIKQKDKEVFC